MSIRKAHIIMIWHHIVLKLFEYLDLKTLWIIGSSDVGEKNFTKSLFSLMYSNRSILVMLDRRPFINLKLAILRTLVNLSLNFSFDLFNLFFLNLHHTSNTFCHQYLIYSIPCLVADFSRYPAKLGCYRLVLHLLLPLSAPMELW